MGCLVAGYATVGGNPAYDDSMAEWSQGCDGHIEFLQRETGVLCVRAYAVRFLRVSIDKVREYSVFQCSEKSVSSIVCNGLGSAWGLIESVGALCICRPWDGMVWLYHAVRVPGIL